MKFRFRWTLGLAVVALFSFGLLAVACEDDDTDDPFNGNGFEDDGMNGNGFEDDGFGENGDDDGFGMRIDGVSGGGSAIITMNGPRLS